MLKPLCKKNELTLYQQMGA